MPVPSVTFRQAAFDLYGFPGVNVVGEGVDAQLNVDALASAQAVPFVDWTDRDVLIVENRHASKAVLFNGIGVALETDGPTAAGPWCAPFIGAKPLGPIVDSPGWSGWSLFALSDIAPRHARFPAPAPAPAPAPFTLAPGHRIEFRFAADPYPMPVVDRKAIDMNVVYAAQALDVPTNDLRMPLDDPELAALDRFWLAGDPNSYNIDDWTLRRFGVPSRIPVVGLHEWGRIPWGDVDCNHHYDAIGAALRSWLRNGDRRAWDAAALMAWRHLQTGVRLGGASRSNGFGLHEYEKCAGTYTGDGGQPAESHAWDAGLAVFAFLTLDPTALRWARTRAQWLETRFPADSWLWQGSGGTRYIGWYAKNCRTMMQLGFWSPMTETQRKDFVLGHVRRVLYWKNSVYKTEWLPNGYTPFGFKPWMDAVAYVELLRWIDYVGLDRGAPEVREVLNGAQWLLANAVHPNGAAPYEVLRWQGTLAASLRNDSYPETIAAWVLPLAVMLRDPRCVEMNALTRRGLDVTQTGAGKAGSAAVKLWNEYSIFLNAARILG